MKRLLALLTAMLLPLIALAEPMCMEMRLTADEAQCAALLSRQLQGLAKTTDSTAYDQIASAIVQLINGSRVSLYSDDQNVAFELQLNDKTLLDLTVNSVDNGYRLTSELMPGYGLLVPEAALDEDPVTALLLEQDWPALLQEMLDAAMQAPDQIEAKTQRGSFSGDAYRGGASCTTIRLNDSDIAAVLQAVMTPDVRSLIKSVLADSGMDADKLLTQLDAMHQRAASENTYAYIIRLVSDENDVLIGVSAILLNGERQLATLSLELQPDGMNIVLGLGQAEKNVWSAHKIRTEAQEQGIKLHGESCMFTGEKDESFAYASAAAETMDVSGSWSLTFASGDENNMSMQFKEEKTFQDSALKDDGSFTSGMQLDAVMQGSSWEAKAVWSAMDAKVLELQLEYKPAQAMTPSGKHVTLCDLSSNDETQLAMLDVIVGTIESTLLRRLLTIIPAELLLVQP